jgi:predicted nuclease with TOPRIM domain
MPEPDWNLIGEQMDRMLREQAGLRDENREIRAALGAIVRKLDDLDRDIGALADDVSLLKVEVRAVGDRLNGTEPGTSS